VKYASRYCHALGVLASWDSQDEDLVNHVTPYFANNDGQQRLFPSCGFINGYVLDGRQKISHALGPLGSVKNIIRLSSGRICKSISI